MKLFLSCLFFCLTNAILIYGTNPCVGFAVDINVFGNTTLCTGDSVILQANTGTLFNWNNGAQSQSIVVKEAGVYNVVVEDANNCVAVSPTISVSILNAFEAEIILNGDSIICPGETLILTSNIDENFSWSNGNPTQSVITSSPGTYVLTVTDNFGCEVDVDAVTLVEQSPEIVDIEAFDPTIFCEGVSVNLFLTIPDSYNFNWNVGGNDTILNVSTSGAYYVFGNDPTTGCSFYSDTIDVLVGEPVMPLVTYLGDTIMCEGDSIQLMSTESFAYYWTDGQTSQNIVVKDTGGLFTVTSTDFYGCNVMSEAINILYEPNLEPPKICGDSLIQIGNTYNYSTDAPDNYNFIWTVTGGQVDVNGLPTVNVIWDNSETEKSICVAVDSEQGCTSNSNCFSIKLATSFLESEELNVSIYPNPSSNFLEVRSSEVNVKEVSVYTYEGKNIMQSKNTTLDVSNIEAGKYFLRILTSQGLVFKNILILH